jgi:hypothetical protein
MALVTGWVVAIFLPSAVIALLAQSGGLAARLLALPGGTFQVADDVGPAAKLTVMALMGLPLLLLDRFARRRRGLYFAIAAAIPLVAFALTLALLPARYSRGFGVGLTGLRFDPEVLWIYLSCGVASGLAYAVTSLSCKARQNSA